MTRVQFFDTEVELLHLTNNFSYSKLEKGLKSGWIGFSLKNTLPHIGLLLKTHQFKQAEIVSMNLFSSVFYPT
jgi:hypothetical protein